MSTDFAMEDWDLEAVVRGFTNGSPSTINNNMESYPPKWFIPLSTQEDQDRDLLFTTTFPEFFETTTVLDELEQLYKPFYPLLNPISPPTILTTSSISVPKEEKEKEKEQEKVQEKQSLASSANIVAPAKHKRRKNQQKRVVIQVTAEGLSADMWAWRKYGQKPIKGSPYPRSYYRCSSLKGCLARKQVERNHLDPEMFIVTYTAEHSHTKPTRRSSLAGTTRHKSPTSTGGDRLIVTTPTSTTKDCSCSPISGASSLSPTTPSLSATIEDDHYFLQADEAMKNESKVDINEEQIVQDMILSEDFFSGLDFELDGLASEHVAFGHCFPADQFNFQMSFPC